MYTIQDALVESQHNKIKTVLKDGTRIVLEKHVYGLKPEDTLWLLHAASPGKQYVSWRLKAFASVASTLLEHYQTVVSAEIWLPIELAQRLPAQGRATQ